MLSEQGVREDVLTEVCFVLFIGGRCVFGFEGQSNLGQETASHV